MSEPTPLSAERALNLLRMAARVDPLLRKAVADVELHIDAQATEIAALKGALENLMDEQNGPPLIRDAASWQVAMDNARRVLARKEAKE